MGPDRRTAGERLAVVGHHCAYRTRSLCRFQRLEKLLESALVKVSSVASKLATISAQDMIKAMAAFVRRHRTA